MFDRFKTYYNQGNQFYGIDLYAVNNTLQIQLIDIKRIKGELEITGSTIFKDYNALFKGLKKNFPICLSLRTSDVIGKTIQEPEESKDPNALVQGVFPNLDPEKFYFEIYKLNQVQRLAIVKHTIVEEILNLFDENGYSILRICLEWSSLTPLEEIFTSNSLLLPNQSLEFGGSPTEIRSIDLSEGEEKVYEVRGMELSSQIICAFGSILKFLISDDGGYSNFAPREERLKANFQYKRKFNLISKGMVLSVLVVLLTNFLFYNHYFNRANELRTQIALGESQLTGLTKLKSEVKLKNRRWEAVNQSGQSRVSFLLDRIAKDIPSSVTLEELNFQPLSKNIKENEPIDLLVNQILISGNASSTDEFTNWVETLENLEEVVAVETLDFDRENNRSSYFTLKLLLNAAEK